MDFCGFAACADWANANTLFGQTVQHKLAEMKTEICVTRAFVDQCVQLHLRGRLDTSMACMAKIWYPIGVLFLLSNIGVAFECRAGGGADKADR